MTHIQPIKIEFIKNNASICVVGFKLEHLNCLIL